MVCSSYRAIKLFCRNEAKWDMHGREECQCKCVQVEIRGDIENKNSKTDPAVFGMKIFLYNSVRHSSSTNIVLLE